jgi:hypothetical protein
VVGTSGSGAAATAATSGSAASLDCQWHERVAGASAVHEKQRGGDLQIAARPLGEASR